MAVPSIQFEAKVRATTRRSNKSGDWWSVTLEIHPNDFQESLCEMAGRQQQVVVVLAQVDDSGQPVSGPGDSTGPEKPKRPPAESRAELARRLCGVPGFQWFIQPMVKRNNENRFQGNNMYEVTSNYVKWHCVVKSKNDLDKSPESMALWDGLYTEYQQATGRMAENR